MSKIKTFKGMLPIGEQEKIHLSTNNGLIAYKINKFQILPKRPGTNSELIGQIFTTDQTGKIDDFVDFSDTNFLAAAYYKEGSGTAEGFQTKVVFDKETFNQDIFVYITNPAGGTDPCNFYIELEQFDIDINTSTYHTLKNIRSITGPGFEFL